MVLKAQPSNVLRANGVKGTALKWFESYLSKRVQAVTIDEIGSDLHHLIDGVAQGSVLGPIIFILYTSPLGDLLKGMWHLFPPICR